MKVLGTIFTLILVIWSMITIGILSHVKDWYVFLKAPGFPIIIVGYILIFVIYYVAKKFVEELPDE